MNYKTADFKNYEIVAFNNPDFPANIRKGFLSCHPNYSSENHRHNEVEFILAISGNMSYNINGNIVKLNQGDGIFVNANQMRFGYSEERKECIYICALLSPTLLCFSKVTEQKYVSPLLFNKQIPYYHFKRKNTWEKNILDSVLKLYDYGNDKLSELKIQKTFLNIWITLFENTLSVEREIIFKNHHLSTLKNMISYINDNYKEKICLKSILDSGNVCNTSCCNIFKTYLNKTPSEYLTEFRLQKSIELLTNTDMTVIEISCEVGFSGASYFTEIFHKYFGCTPSDYRKGLVI